MKIMTVVGTRPEIIRLSRVIAQIDECVTQTLVHTGQNYDYELNEIFFNEMGIRRPDYFLDANRGSLGKSIGDIISKGEDVIKKEKPDAMLILGDTNSSLIGIIAKRLKVPLFHMEAGNRCFDLNVPEETNRKIIDHIADINLVYTEHARRNLIAEGLDSRKIYLTGSPMSEVIAYYMNDINKSTIVQKMNLLDGEYFVLSVHREETVEYDSNIRKVFKAVEELSEEYGWPVIASIHPRTMKKIREFNIEIGERILLSKPLGYFDYMSLQRCAGCVISDSGTISEESAIMNFPAITIRNAIERPEAIDNGSIVLSGIDEENISMSVRLAMVSSRCNTPHIPVEYGIHDTSWRVLKVILGLHNLTFKWNGIENV